jgi:hypothetical protein
MVAWKMPTFFSVWRLTQSLWCILIFLSCGFDSFFQVWEYLEIQDALSAGPDFLGAVGILLATIADFDTACVKNVKTV